MSEAKRATLLIKTRSDLRVSDFDQLYPLDLVTKEVMRFYDKECLFSDSYKQAL